MVTLEQTLRNLYDWSIDRMHELSEYDIESAAAIQSEFKEWFDSDIKTHDIYLVEHLRD